MNSQISMRNYYGHNYDEFLMYQAYYRILKSGKNAKKSSVEAREIVQRALTDPCFCAVVLRKIFKDHGSTTYAAIIKAFNWIKNRTGYDYTKDWVSAIGSNNPRIENIKTGQVIRFASFDRPNSLGGYELESEYLYYGDLWFEEPMQISDIRNRPSRETQEQEQHDFEIIESSVHRGDLPHKNAFRTVTFTFNDWSYGSHWILEKFIKTFVREDYRILDIYGKQVYYNPAYQNDKGIFVQVTSAGVNEFMDDNYKNYLRDIRENDYEFYKAIGLGTRSTFVGNAYGAGNFQKIKRKIDLSLVEQFAIGWDYASSKDETAIVLVGLNRGTFDLQVIDVWSYHRGRAKNPIGEPDLIKVMMEVITMWQKQYGFSITENMTPIHGDSHDSLVNSLLQQEWDNLPGYMQVGLEYPQAAAKFDKASSFIRIMVTRWLMGAGKLWIAPHLDDFYDQLKSRTIEKDGSPRDGNDDKVQAFEYAWSFNIEELIPYHHYQILIDQQQVKIWERRTNDYQIQPPGL